MKRGIEHRKYRDRKGNRTGVLNGEGDWKGKIKKRK